MKVFSNAFAHFIDLILPRHCICCECKLLFEEKFICTSCLFLMPLSKDWEIANNSLKLHLEKRIPVELAASLLNYDSQSKYHRILHLLKYKNRPEIGNYFGEILGRFIMSNPDFMHADYICPVPLHSKKLKKRGYNQSLHLAQGIAKSTGIPLNDSNLIRTINTSSQTKKGQRERQENLIGAFHCIDPDIFQDKHIILVDDIVTTGSTIAACVYAILPKSNARISVLSMGRVGN
ncbi:MAG: ComF family protein [Mangrovibacterium sp.]